LRLIVRSSLHFLAFGFFFKILIVTSVKYSVSYLVSYMVWLGVSLVWGLLDITSNIQPFLEITYLSFSVNKPFKPGVPVHVIRLEETKSEERNTTFECRDVDLVCRNNFCVLYVRNISAYTGDSVMPVSDVMEHMLDLYS
jgi:hypothetical protein